MQSSLVSTVVNRVIIIMLHVNMMPQTDWYMNKLTESYGTINEAIAFKPNLQINPED